MKTAFTAESPVGQIWRAVVHDCAVQAKSAEACAAELHTGYVENAALSPLRIFRPDALTAGEVLEHAYRFERFWPVLVKHGFPVPFAVDDYDPATKEDAQVRERLQAAAAQATSAAVSQGFALGSDAYQHAVATAVYEWGVRELDFAADCDEEADAVSAWQQRCGACSETSYLMYRALQYAGLVPVFVWVPSPPPTLEVQAAYERMTADQQWSEHVAVGVYDRAGRLLQLDPFSGLFDAQYTDAMPLTPRQMIAAGWYGNRLMNAPDAAERGTQLLLQELAAVAPADLGFWARACLEPPIPAVLGALCEDADRMLASYAPATVWKAAFQMAQAAMRGDPRYVELKERALTALDALGAADPRAAAWLTLRIGRGLIGLAQIFSTEAAQVAAPPGFQLDVVKLTSDLRRQVIDLFTKALLWQPGRMAVVSALQRLAYEAPETAPAVRVGLDAVTRRHPTHAAARYAALRIRLQEMERGGAAPADFPGLLNALAAVAPKHPRVAVLRARWLQLNGRIADAVTCLHEGMAEVPDDAGAIVNAALIYCAGDAVSDAERLLMTMLDRDGAVAVRPVDLFLSRLSPRMRAADTEPLIGLLSGTCGAIEQTFFRMGLRLAAQLKRYQQGDSAQRHAVRFGLMALLAGDRDGWNRARTALLPEVLKTSVVEAVHAELVLYGDWLLRAAQPRTMKEILTPQRVQDVIERVANDLWLTTASGELVPLAWFGLGVAKQYLWARQYAQAAALLGLLDEFDPGGESRQRYYVAVAQPFFASGETEIFLQAVRIGRPAEWSAPTVSQLRIDLKSLLTQPRMPARHRQVAKAIMRSLADE